MMSGLVATTAPFVEEKLPLHKEVRAKIRALSFASGQVLVGELQKQDLSLPITVSLEHEVTGEGEEGETNRELQGMKEP